MSLRQPPLRLPPWIFGPVWTVLYGLMGYASYRGATAGPSTATEALVHHGNTVYTMQLCLNLLWMPLFFGVRAPITAAVDILALCGFTMYLAYVYAQIDGLAAWCFAPYLGWLGFVAFLTIGVGYLSGWDIRDKIPKMR